VGVFDSVDGACTFGGATAPGRKDPAMPRPRIVVVGAGFAGFAAARRLANLAHGGA